MNGDLFKVYELQRKEQIHACMLLGGIDDQDPTAWHDMECMPTGDLNIPVAVGCSTDSDDKGDLESMDEGQGESGGFRRPNIPTNVLCSVETDEGSHNEDSGASHDSDEGEDSEASDRSPGEGPRGKRAAPVPGSRKGRAKNPTS